MFTVVCIINFVLLYNFFFPSQFVEILRQRSLRYDDYDDGDDYDDDDDGYDDDDDDD